MDHEARIAFILSQIACANIEAMGMVAENKQRESMQQSLAYVGDDFQRLPETYGIDHNSVIEYLRE